MAKAAPPAIVAKRWGEAQLLDPLTWLPMAAAGKHKNKFNAEIWFSCARGDANGGQFSAMRPPTVLCGIR
jgi:hypothetical protein